MGRGTDSEVLSGGLLSTPPCPEDELRSEGLRLHLLIFPCPQPWARGKEGPAPGLGIVPRRGTFVWQPLPHPHPGYLEVLPALPSLQS